MANEDLRAEIELMRKQLEELQKEREAETKPSDVVEPEQPAVSQVLGEAGEATASATDVKGEDLVAQLKELLDSIDKDIKDTKPTTLLLVFALGVLVGRL